MKTLPPSLINFFLFFAELMILLNVLFEKSIIGTYDLEDYILNYLFLLYKNDSFFSILCDLNSIFLFSNSSLWMLFNVWILFHALCLRLHDFFIEHILNLDSLNYWFFLKLVGKSFK